MAAVSRKLWTCGPPKRDPIVLAIINVLWQSRSGKNCNRYTGPPPLPLSAQVIANAIPQYSQDQVFRTLKLWTRRGLFIATPCVGVGGVQNDEVSFEINPIAAQVNIMNQPYLSPNAIIPINQEPCGLCTFNPCSGQKGALIGVSKFPFLSDLSVRERQKIINRRNPANAVCGSIYCREATSNNTQ